MMEDPCCDHAKVLGSLERIEDSIERLTHLYSELNLGKQDKAPPFNYGTWIDKIIWFVIGVASALILDVMRV